MKVARDEHTAEYDNNVITMTLVGDIQMTERQLDNFLQFVLLGVGLDVKHQDPPDPEPPRPEIPEHDN